MNTISDTPITLLTLSSLYTSPSPIVTTTVQGVLFLNLQMRKQKGQSQDSHPGMDLVQNPVFCLQSPDAGCPETFMSIVPRGQAGETQPNQRLSHVRMSLSPKCYGRGPQTLASAMWSSTYNSKNVTKANKLSETWRDTLNETWRCDMQLWFPNMVAHQDHLQSLLFFFGHAKQHARF